MKKFAALFATRGRGPVTSPPGRSFEDAYNDVCLDLLTAEVDRDRAREIAVALEQELAHLQGGVRECLDHPKWFPGEAGSAYWHLRDLLGEDAA